MHKFFVYKDLADLGIRATYGTVISWMDQGLFPPAVRISPGRVGWRNSDVEKYIDATGEGLRPRLWPVRQRVKANGPELKRGRQPGTRVVVIDGRKRVVPAADAVDAR